MKKVFYFLSFVALTAFSFMNSAYAQIQTPSASPKATITQAFGLSEISLEYSRPSAKGRTIFAADGLVPFGKIWRTGANQAAKITFGDDVTVEGKELKKGSYAILTKPGATSWDVHFYTYEGSGWSSYVEKTPDAVVTVKPVMLPMHIETYMMAFGTQTSNSIDLEILWEKTNVVLNIKTAVHDKVMAQIDKVLAGPTNGDYYNAGVYMANNGGDMNKALMYVQKATKAEDAKFWQLRQESLILGKMGKKAEAIAVAKKSLALATKAGNADYVKMNNDSIKEWSM